MDVLKKILDLRLQRGWSEYRLSEESGIAQTTISSWYRKQINPTITSLEKICDAYSITMSEFFCNDEDAVILTKEQTEMLNQVNRLSKEQQKKLLEFLRLL